MIEVGDPERVLHLIKHYAFEVAALVLFLHSLGSFVVTKIRGKH